MIRFKAQAYFQGSKREEGTSPCITVPLAHRTLGGTFEPPGWVKLRVNGGAAFFAYARRPRSRESVDITLSRRWLPNIKGGNVVDVEIESGAPYAAKPGKAATDWLPFTPRDRYFPVDDGEDLVLWNSHEEPFRLKRAPVDGFSHWWLLGFYQAEGSKKNALDFHAANTSPELLGWMRDALGVWGISTERQRLGVVHRPWTPPAEARSVFEPLGLPITFVTAKPKNDTAALLYVNASLPLIRLVSAKLEHVFKNGFPSKEAAKAFALGWLDGDGSICGTGSAGWSIELRLAGYRDEQEVVIRALEQGLDWTLQKGAFGAVDRFTARTLTLAQAAELAIAGGFNASLNRARLVHLLAERLLRYNGLGRTRTSEAEVERAWCLFKQLAKEATALEQHPLAASRFKTGEKCAPYPKEKGRPDQRSERPWTETP